MAKGGGVHAGAGRTTDATHPAGNSPRDGSEPQAGPSLPPIARDRARAAEDERLRAQVAGLRRLLALSLGVLLALGGVAGAGEHVAVARPLAIYGAAAGADYLSTRYALAAGAREGNPLMHTHRSLVGWKAAQVGLLLGMDVALQKGGHRGKARALRITAAVVGAGLAGWNMHTAARQRRHHGS